VSSQHAAANGSRHSRAHDNAARGGIVIEGLTVEFGEVRALDGLNLEVSAGEIVALLGPNGAGKTTAIQILSTLLKPDHGRALVGGYDVVRSPGAVRRQIALTGQFAAVDVDLTGRENLELFARLHHLPMADSRARAAELIERFDLCAVADRLAKKYSGGTRRRLDLAVSLVSRPQVLFLDEPTTGLDPRSRRELWRVIRELAASGTTILLTTQYLEEADELAERIAVMDHGRIVAEGSGYALKQDVGGERLELRLRNLEELRRARDVLARTGHRGELDEPNLRLRMTIDNGAELVPEVISQLCLNGLTVEDLGICKPTLEDVFLALTGKSAAGTERPLSHEDATTSGAPR